MTNKIWTCTSQLALFASLCAAAWGCNKAQRTPLREPELLAASLTAPDLPALPGEDVPRPDSACLLLGDDVTGCLPPGGGTVEVGPAGGTIATSDGNLRLTIPPAALSQPTALTVGPATTPPWTAGYVSHAYDLGPESVRFAIPATLSLAHEAVDLPGGKASKGRLALHMVVDRQWRRLHESRVDARAGRVSAPIDRLGTAATLVPTTALTVSSDPARLRVGEVRQLSAATVPEGRAVSWSIVPAGVATIHPRTGLLAAIAPGRARVVAASAGTFTQTSIVVVPDW